ncbi:hypothetical protein E1B28_002301 [Marasmius oreades]|uniref:GmrSD restriction endonucleases N-terminal domain-containing protein n=1 Tax=Marasmius oreades TaxID=181124 RepID=A0A9P7RMD6_9AGAR|nr:uncharacterized protein E1B28_002301 [Marasmius oreades]KAG7086339.1 hypothetical protein E1B28_002301 [Marasmius oreades]
MASDDESVLTEYDELEGEEEEGSRSSNKKKASTKHEYTLKNALKQPRATTYTTQALYQQIHSGDIELDPEYQRDVVWKDEKQIKLVDSILRNFYIPPVIFAYRAEDDGTEFRTCIDGKQRLTSIHRFMDGLIPHKDHYTGELLWFKDNGDNRGRTKKNILPAKLRTSFTNKQIVCVEYSDLRDCDERDIFKRVQLGVALTTAEKMNVIKTPRADFVRFLMERYLTAERLGNPEIPWSMARGTDFKCIASSVFIISNRAQMTFSGTVQVENWLAETNSSSLRASKNSKKTSGSDDNDGDYNDSSGVPLPDSFRQKVIETFEVMVKLANNKKYNQAFRPSPAASNISPIEITGIPVLIHNVYVSPPSSSPARGDDRVSLQRLSDLILLLRAYLHKNHTDVRQNSRVGKDMLQFCLGASKDPNRFFQEHSELLGWKAPSKVKRGANRSATSSSKRKKAATKEESYDESEDDDEEYQTTKRPRTSAIQGARKSTGGRAPPTPQPTIGPSSAPVSTRKSPPNPQMLPSPDPASTPSHSTVKCEPETQMPLPSQMFPSYQFTDMQAKEWYQQQQQQQQARMQMMAGSSIGMDPTLMAYLSSQQAFPFMNQSLPQQSLIQRGGSSTGDGRQRPM